MLRSVSKNRFHPSVEGLEQRSLLAVNVLENAGVLFIQGDEAANHIEVRDYGNGDVRGSVGGQDDFSFSGIYSIVIDSGAGNDHVSYDLAQDLQPGLTHFVEVNMRDGNDHFDASFGSKQNPSNMLPGSELMMKVVGENGNDHIALDATGVTMDHATMKIGFYGGAGNDQIDMAYSGLVDHGGVSFFAFGNEDNDTIRLSMLADPASIAPAPGGFRGIIEADDGNDAIFFKHSAPSTVSTDQLSIDGGDGTDHAHTSLDPADVSNCEVVN